VTLSALDLAGNRGSVSAPLTVTAPPKPKPTPKGHH